MDDPKRRGEPVGAEGKPEQAGTADPSEDMILAAVRRAALHDGGSLGGAPLSALLAHLAIRKRTGLARAVRRRLEELERSGRLERGRVHGIEVWKLAAAGKRRLAAAARAGRGPALPESPQHLAWRGARAAAGQELDRFAVQLAADLAEADAMLAALHEADQAPPSDLWAMLGRRLHGDCRRLASAWHCLHEWDEPDDARPDRDDPGSGEPAELRVLRAGRRNVVLWADPDRDV